LLVKQYLIYALTFVLVVLSVLKLQKILVALINPSQAGALVRKLGPAAPLAGLQHLKRVRKLPDTAAQLEIILCPVGEPQLAKPGNDRAAQPTEWTALGLKEAGIPDAVIRIISEERLLLRTAVVSFEAMS
jgi:hypothetical protein